MRVPEPFRPKNSRKSCRVAKVGLEKGHAGKSSLALKWLIAFMAVGLITTSLLGIYMAFIFNREPRIVCSLVALGIIIPVVALLFR
jgi:hypothetical protein